MPSKYVLFREDPASHKEVYYVAEGRKGERVQSHDLTKAMRFESARAAYGHGAQLGLLYWKAGVR